ncbi:acyl-CoA thioesterase [Halalkalicoccus salilacus]|uniref:acyl-CoA thioesterase n=1 Tax=Halalkalicoccus sp. GCM10025704 TaxID=3252662 RepID=UPI00361A5AFE
MQTIANHRVQFGELAGPVVHGASFFDWQLISTQEIAAAFDYSFEEILAADGIPYAPVVVSTSVDRYPTTGDMITVETWPRSVGDSSVELIYEITDGDGKQLATARMIHVTISQDGTALPLPERVRPDIADACVNYDPTVGPGMEPSENKDLPSFSSSFQIHSPHIEGAELAYFEEYPRFADIALEEYLSERGTSLVELRGRNSRIVSRTGAGSFRRRSSSSQRYGLAVMYSKSIVRRFGSLMSYPVMVEVILRESPNTVVSTEMGPLFRLTSQWSHRSEPNFELE